MCIKVYDKTRKLETYKDVTSLIDPDMRSLYITVELSDDQVLATRLNFRTHGGGG